MIFELGSYQIDLKVKHIGRRRATNKAAADVLTWLYWALGHAEAELRTIPEEYLQEGADGIRYTREALKEVIREAQK